MPLPPDRSHLFRASRAAGPNVWKLPSRPRRWLTIRQSGGTRAVACCDGFDGLVDTLVYLPAAIYHVRDVGSELILATAHRRFDGTWELYRFHRRAPR